jgi:hypothetical protein
MKMIDPQIPGIRILEGINCPRDGVMFQNLWDAAIIGMNWSFRFADGTTASSGSDDLNQFRVSPGEIAVAVPHRIIVIDRPQEPERRLWSETQQIPADYVEFLLRTQQRSKNQPEETLFEQQNKYIHEGRDERTAEKLRNAYERLGVPRDSLPSVDELKNQLEESNRQLEQIRRPKPIPAETKLSWALFEDGLFYGTTRSAHCLLLLWSFSRKIRSFATTAQSTDLGVDHPLTAEFAEVRRRTASGPEELAHLVDQLPESDREMIKKIMPIPGHEVKN